MDSASYTFLDFGGELRLEQWGQYRLIRPDPVAVGPVADRRLWEDVDATYIGEKGKGYWQKRGGLPGEWPVTFDSTQMLVRLTAFKHTGVFPEQIANWRWMKKISGQWAAGGGQLKKEGEDSRFRVLNLFGYTGGATCALAGAGCFVTHVDASKPSVAWAKENAALNGLAADGVRWIVEDARAFVAREQRRGKKYDGIVLDPPAFGYAETGKTWRMDRDLVPLLEGCLSLLSERPGVVVLNGYARGDTPEKFERLLKAALNGRRGKVEAKELMLRAVDGRELSTGVVARVAF